MISQDAFLRVHGFVLILIQAGQLRATSSLFEGGSMDEGAFEVELDWLGCGQGDCKRSEEE